MTTDELLLKVKDFDKKVRTAQSDRDRYLGEQSQLESQRQEIIEEIRKYFNCSPKELVEKLVIMKKDLEEKVSHIEKELE